VADYLATHIDGDVFRVWVAEDGGRIVAMGGLVLVDRPPHPRSRRTGEGFIVNVYTLPRWRGRGAGRAVMDALVADARSLRLRRVYLRTSDDGRPLYDGMGFRDPGNYLSLDLD
jgi:GNAT superfamily N-acetyltransferase